jgi:hypothetical protein
MTTLHNEHPISDYTAWRGAFDRFAPLRAQAGVIAQRVFQPIDDVHHVVIQLDFPDDTRAAAFLDLLTTTIWPNAEASPALRGTPRTILLEPRPESPTR